MEVEEHGAEDGGEKEVFGELFRIPCSNEYNSGGIYRNQSLQSLQNTRHIHTLNTKHLKHLRISSPDPCSLTSVIKHIKEKKVVNPSLWAELSQSEVIRGHGVVKRAHAFEEENEEMEMESSHMVTDGDI